MSDATLKIARKGTLGDTYHISGYELVSIRTLVEMILTRLGKSFDDCVEIGPERPGKDTAYTLDSFKLRTELGWRDTLSLAARHRRRHRLGRAVRARSGEAAGQIRTQTLTTTRSAYGSATGEHDERCSPQHRSQSSMPRR